MDKKSTFGFSTDIFYLMDKGDIKNLRKLIHKNKKSFNTKNKDGNTPLYLASRRKNVEFVKFILNECDDINVNIRNGPKKTTALYATSSNGCIEIMKLLVHKGANIEVGGQNGICPLHKAAKRGHFEMVKFLTNETSVDINSRDLDGYTPLHYACSGGYPKIIKLLISKEGINPNIKTLNDGYTPLRMGIMNLTPKIIRIMVTKTPNINVNLKDNMGDTPLHVISKSNLDKVKILVDDGGTDVNVKNKYNLTALYYASIELGLDIMRYLLLVGAHYDYLIGKTSAINEQQQEILKEIIQDFEGYNVKGIPAARGRR